MKNHSNKPIFHTIGENPSLHKSSFCQFKHNNSVKSKYITAQNAITLLPAGFSPQILNFFDKFMASVKILLYR